MIRVYGLRSIARGFVFRGGASPYCRKDDLCIGFASFLKRVGPFTRAQEDSQKDAFVVHPVYDTSPMRVKGLGFRVPKPLTRPCGIF